MAVVQDSTDKMRDLIAAEAAKLTTDEPNETTAEVDETPVEEAPEGEVAEVEPPAEGEVVEPDPGKVVEEPAAAAAKVVEPVADAGKPKAKKEDEHPFAKEHGIKSKDALGRENRIPFSRVLKITENKVKAAKADWEKTVLAPERAKITTYEGRLNAIAETERIQFEEPRRFLTMLTAIPGYKQLFDEISGGKFTAGGEKPAKVDDGTILASDPKDPEPQPDAKDDKGNIIGWTQEGLNKLRAWDRRQSVREGAAAAKAAIDAEYKPIRERFQTVQADEQLGQSIDGIITVAAEWPGFAENHAAILDVVAKGTEKLDTPQKMYTAVQRAYNTVMFGAVTKVRETEEQARERYFTEFQDQLKKAPRSTQARSTVRREEPLEVTEHASADDRMRAIIAEQARKLG